MASSNLPALWKFDYGDYSDLGATFQKFLGNVNLFTTATYNILNGGIQLQNLQRAIYTATVTAASTTPLAFVNPLPVAPSGLSLVQILQSGKTAVPITSPISVANWTYDGKYINILNISGLTSGNTYQVAIEVL